MRVLARKQLQHRIDDGVKPIAGPPRRSRTCRWCRRSRRGRPGWRPSVTRPWRRASDGGVVHVGPGPEAHANTAVSAKLPSGIDLISEPAVRMPSVSMPGNAVHRPARAERRRHERGGPSANASASGVLPPGDSREPGRRRRPGCAYLRLDQAVARRRQDFRNRCRPSSGMS